MNSSQQSPDLRYDTVNILASWGRLERWLAERLMTLAGNPPLRITLQGELLAEHNCPVGTLHIQNRRTLLRIVCDPDFLFPEAYVKGTVDIEGDIAQTLTSLFRSLPSGNYCNAGVRLLNRLYLLHSNDPGRAKSNIHHHYDIGNDFYQRWLDERMQYTCAYFPRTDVSLEKAQQAKLDHICRKLRLQPGDTVVEAGCGWGGLARHMASHYGVKVRAYNISQQQVAYARERAAAEGLSDRIEYILDDYRNINGQYDAFVSVGMLEHVGTSHYQELGTIIQRAMKPHGRGLIHSIGRNRPAPMNRWIEKRIFPGAYPPSLGEMSSIFEPCQLSILDVENLRLHYAVTLEHWLERFEAHRDWIRERFDEAFLRAWRFYLASSIAAFRCGELQLFQVLFNRFDHNDIPLTRHYLYS